MRGVASIHFFKIIFTAKTRHFQGCLRGLGDTKSVDTHARKLALIYHVFTFSIVFTSKKRMDKSTLKQ